MIRMTDILFLWWLFLEDDSTRRKGMIQKAVGTATVVALLPDFFHVIDGNGKFPRFETPQQDNPDQGFGGSVLEDP